MVQDYPDGFRGSVMGGTVDPVTTFFIPWCQNTTHNIAAGASYTYNITFTDPNYVFYVDMVDVTPQANTPFYILVKVNGSVVAIGSDVGALVLSLRSNPSIHFIEGDSIDIEVYNTDSSAHDFIIIANGSKALRPTTLGVPPNAYFTFTPHFGYIPFNIQFTDASTHSPTSWKWYLDGVTVVSTEQNPLIPISSKGLYTPLLEASNEYGSDTYQVADGILAASPINPNSYEAYSYYGTISVSGQVVTANNINRLSQNYLRRYYGANHFDAFDIVINFKVTGGETGCSVVMFGLGQKKDNFPLDAGYSLAVRFFSNSWPSISFIVNFFQNTSSLAAWGKAITLNTEYTVRLVHASGSTTVYVYLYSGYDTSNLIDSGTLTHANLTAKYSCCYLCSSWYDGQSYKGSFTSVNRGMIVGDA